MDVYAIPTAPMRVKITPEMAANWLEHRNAQFQRRYSNAMARKWAREMSAGRWKCTHQGIAFDRDGFLIDGQHRLGAIILTGLTIEMWVFPDCDPASFDVLDQGLKRQANQMITGPNPAVVAAAARILAVVTNAVPRSGNVQGGVYDGTLSTGVILEVVEQWPEITDFMLGVQSCYRATRINRPMHLAVIAQASRTRYRDRLGSWLDGLTTGVALNGNDPRLHLRNRFIREGANLAYMHGPCYKLIVKAWNAHAQQRPIGALKVLESEGVVPIVD